MAPIPGFPRIDRIAGHAGQSILHALTPRTGEPSGVPAPQSFSDYWRSQAAAFDPRTPSGVLDLVSLFAPGSGRGGKFVGRPTELQARFLRQLGGQVNPRRIDTPGGGRDFFPDPIWERKGTGEGIPIPGSVNIDTDPSVRAIAEKLGYTTGDPLTELWNLVHRQPTAQEIKNESFFGEASTTIHQLNAKLGQVQDRLPEWALTEKQQRALWREQSRGRPYDEVAARELLAQIRQRRVDEIARIVSTMKRRGQG